MLPTAGCEQQGHGLPLLTPSLSHCLTVTYGYVIEGERVHALVSGKIVSTKGKSQTAMEIPLPA